MSGLSFLLLQTGFMGVKWFKDDNPIMAILLAVTIGIVVVVLVVLNIKKVGIGDTGLHLKKPGGDAVDAPRKFNLQALHRAARPYGLNQQQLKVLDSVFRAEGVTDAAKTLSTPNLLDECFRSAYKRMDRSEGEEDNSQHQLSVLFSARNAIDFALNAGSAEFTKPTDQDDKGAGAAKARKFRRREINAACTYNPVVVKETREGLKKKVKMTVSGKAQSGTIMDISVGGCAVKTSEGVKAGTRLKIGFHYPGGASASVLGQVLRVNQGGGNTILHIKFLKVPRKSLNAINAGIFGYAD